MRPKNNLDKGELDAPKDLKRCDDMIITNPDKDGTIVIMDTINYFIEVQLHRQLQNTSNYNQLPNDPTKINSKLINDMIIDTFQEENIYLIKDTAEALKVPDSKIP